MKIISIIFCVTRVVKNYSQRRVVHFYVEGQVIWVGSDGGQQVVSTIKQWNGTRERNMETICQYNFVWTSLQMWITTMHIMTKSIIFVNRI